MSRSRTRRAYTSTTSTRRLAMSGVARNTPGNRVPFEQVHARVDGGRFEREPRTDRERDHDGERVRAERAEIRDEDETSGEDAERERDRHADEPPAERRRRAERPSASAARASTSERPRRSQVHALSDPVAERSQDDREDDGTPNASSRTSYACHASTSTMTTIASVPTTIRVRRASSTPPAKARGLQC